MDKICNFDIVINTCLAEINPASVMPDFDKNGFLLSVINGFEDGAWRKKSIPSVCVGQYCTNGSIGRR